MPYPVPDTWFVTGIMLREGVLLTKGKWKPIIDWLMAP